MKEPQKTNRKQITELRKHSVSEKTRSDNSNGPTSKQEPISPFFTRGMKSLGRKYAQQNVFKVKEKEHHEIVISDEVVRNSKMYRLLREKMVMKDAIFMKECNQLAQVKSKLRQEIAEIKSSSYNSKLALWQLKNQILELKGILTDQQEESQRLNREALDSHNNYLQQYQEEQQGLMYQGQGEEQQQQQQQQIGQDSNETGQQQEMVVSLMSHLGRQMRINPQKQQLQKDDQSFQDALE